jgi:hypothetical protein
MTKALYFYYRLNASTVKFFSFFFECPGFARRHPRSAAAAAAEKKVLAVPAGGVSRLLDTRLA